jgi:hypothetical protein
MEERQMFYSVLFFLGGGDETKRRAFPMLVCGYKQSSLPPVFIIISRELLPVEREIEREGNPSTHTHGER